MSLAGRRVDAGWLALRGDEDARARTDFDGPPRRLLTDHLEGSVHGRPVRLIDVAAGTGAGASWLRPLLPFAQEWRLLDLDGDLLARAPAVRAGWATPIVADIAGLGGVLAESPADVVTCQALLDLLSEEQVAQVLAPTCDARAAVWCALTVTGVVRLDPTDPDDDLVATLFNAHQRRSGRLGPDAAAVAREFLLRRGYEVHSVLTPWRLDAGGTDAGRADLLHIWLAGRAAAAAEQAGADDASRPDAWLQRRLESARRGRLTAVVEHVDLLGLPGATRR